jgi:hypothetical protein
MFRASLRPVVQNGGPAKEMKTKILAAAFLFTACLTALACYPPIITQAKLEQIRIGQTTEADLVHLFGPPSIRSVDLAQRITLDWFRSKPIAPEAYIPFLADLGKDAIGAQQLTVVLTPGGRVVRFQAYTSEYPSKASLQSSNSRQPAHGE